MVVNLPSLGTLVSDDLSAHRENFPSLHIAAWAVAFDAAHRFYNSTISRCRGLSSERIVFLVIMLV